MERQLIKSGFVGLFWYDNKTSNLVDCEGEVEFSLSDLTDKNSISPKGVHRNCGGNSSYKLPRGRIEVDGGRIIISVGLSCSDKVIQEVINHFGLVHFRSVIDIKRNKFWDKRM